MLNQARPAYGSPSPSACSLSSAATQVFIMQLLGLLQRQGHRTLIFSQSLVMLGIIEAALQAAGTRFLRIDGSVTSADTRLGIVNEFQNNDDIPVFLLSAKVRLAHLEALLLAALLLEALLPPPSAKAACDDSAW